MAEVVGALLKAGLVALSHLIGGGERRAVSLTLVNRGNTAMKQKGAADQLSFK